MKIVPHLTAPTPQLPIARLLVEWRWLYRIAGLLKPIIAACVLVIWSLASASTANADVACYAHKSTDCSVFLAWDGVVLDNTIIHVAPGVPGGRYSAGLTGTNSAWLEGNYEMVVVNVNPDGSWTGGPSPGAGVSYGNGVNGWRFYSDAPAFGVPVTVTGDLPFLDGYPCDGSTTGYTQHGTIEITIGNMPTPTPPPYTKCNDVRVAGNEASCSSCGANPPPSYAMARYSVHAMLVSLNIQDTPLHYAPAYGPSVGFTVTYNQKEGQQPATFSYSNLGPKWTFGWLSYVTDDPATQRPQTSLYRSGGGAEIFIYDGASQSFVADPQSHALLVKTGATSYERRLPDGSKEVFASSDGATSYPRRIFMTQIVDAAGNSVSIGYDTSFRVTTITDALSQVTNISYELPSDPLKITKVTDPFGRFATFEYTSGQLTRITDEIGIQSAFTYTTGTDSIDSLTTPYGTTTFVSGGSGTNQWIEATDPLGGKERVEYRDQAPGISATDPVAPNATGITNAGLDVANTFYWDKKAMLVAPGDYTKAKITHWLYNVDGTVSGIISSEKQPLENRVWQTYAGQPDYQHTGPSANPSQVARVLGDGSTQLSQFEYNSLGKTTKATDPLGRETTNIYASNNVDLLKIRQTTANSNALLRKFTYNSQHLPLTETDAAGQVTTSTYNAQGQVLTRTNAKNETTTFTYGGEVPAGYLASVTSPPFNGVSAVTSFTYDSFNRVRTVTDPDNYTVTTDYDSLDRKTKVTYPDTTFEQFHYTDNATGAMTLDLTASRDRRGLWTYRHYNANQKMDSITDPANRTTSYGWCTCGALNSITDPKNQTTTFNRDIQSRVYQKVFQDGTTIDYLYEGQTAPNTLGATSRLQSSTDAKSQRTNYLYFPDDNVQQISYTDTTGQSLTPPTPSVSYTYDAKFNRVKTMTDGIGVTTYSYNPVASPPTLGASQLASIKGPLGHDTITFNYDELGRITNRSIDGAANSDTWNFDSLGRVSSEVNNLGTFNYSYVGVTSRLGGVTYPGGQSTSYTYFPNMQDKRLQEIKHQTSVGLPISQFDYTYDLEGQIKTWTKNNSGLVTAQRSDLGYDNADQLLTAPVKDATTDALVKQYIYAYDVAGNRTSERVGNKTTAATPNNVNELVSQSGAVNRTLIYDLNGSLINDGSSRTFEWDGANRLVAINYTGTTNRSEFSYDGLSRCVQIVEKTDGVVNSTRKFVWCGTEKCEFRNANDAVTVRVYAQGQYSGGTPYFYTRDHLGSIREMVDGTGSVVARYEYDSYGQSTTVIGTTKPDFNFTGLYRHAKSNLDLAVYRAYDPDLGRWLSRDSLDNAEMSEGTNLYAYVQNSPIFGVDPLGLATITVYKTDGVMDWGEWFKHGMSHLDRSTQKHWGSKYGAPARVRFHNVCTDPVYKHLVNPVRANHPDWGAYIDPPNDAHIDVTSTWSFLYHFTPFFGQPSQYTVLIATCSDGCSM